MNIKEKIYPDAKKNMIVGVLLALLIICVILLFYTVSKNVPAVGKDIQNKPVSSQAFTIRDVNFYNYFKNIYPLPSASSSPWLNKRYAKSWYEEDKSSHTSFSELGTTIGDFAYLDVDSDGQEEAIVNIYGGGTGGYGQFDVYKLIESNGKYFLIKLTVDRAFEGDNLPGGEYLSHWSVSVVGGKIEESALIYMKNDANCCPTGGERSTIFTWTDGELVAESPTDKKNDQQ